MGCLAVWIFVDRPPYGANSYAADVVRLAPMGIVLFGLLAIVAWAAWWKERHPKEASMNRILNPHPFADWVGRPPTDPDYEGWDPDGGPGAR